MSQVEEKKTKQQRRKVQIRTVDSQGMIRITLPEQYIGATFAVSVESADNDYVVIKLKRIAV